MFIKEDIQKAESKITNGSDFPRFIKEIKAMGVIRNDVYVSNGLSAYFDSENQVLQMSPDEYPELVVNEESSAEKLTHALEIHQKGETDYITFCKQAADAGVEKWITDLEEMTCTYLNSEGEELLTENISKI